MLRQAPRADSRPEVLTSAIRGSLVRMAFTINFAHGEKTGRDYYDNDERVNVKDSGVIEVTSADGEQIKLYSPNHWTSLVPGERKKPVSPRVARVR